MIIFYPTGDNAEKPCSIGVNGFTLHRFLTIISEYKHGKEDEQRLPRLSLPSIL